MLIVVPVYAERTVALTQSRGTKMTTKQQTRAILWSFSLLVVTALLAFGCGATQPTSEQIVPNPEAKESPELAPVEQCMDTPVLADGCSSEESCLEGVWPLSGPMPPLYLACSADDDCMVSSYEGCCSQTPLAVNTAYATCHLPSDGSENCDMECDEGSWALPPGLKSVCLDQVCTLQ